jgi:hypothetical protein
MGDIDEGLRIYIKEFIGEVVATPMGRGFARWNRRLCVGVSNLQNDAAQYIVDRISALAVDVGLAIGEPGCNPNVMVIFATDAKFVATYMVENEPLMFRPAGLGSNDMSLSRAAMADFAASERAVRWWHVSMPVDARTGNPAIALPGEGYPTISVAGPSRIHSGIRDDLQLVLIVVDATKLAGTTWQQLGDYLGVVSLAQIDPKANPTAFDTRYATDARVLALERFGDGHRRHALFGEVQRPGFDDAILVENRRRLRRRIRDRCRLAAREACAHRSGLARHDCDRQVLVLPVPLHRRIDVLERQLVHHAAEACEMAFLVEAVEAVVDGVAEPRGRRLGEVQRVLLQERPRELEFLGRHAFVDEQLKFAQRRAQRKRSLVVRQRADPNLEQLHAARHVDGRHVARASLWELLDVRVVAVVEPAQLADDVE